MAEGMSFSGRERNSLFYNHGGGKFTDLSALSAFDLPDDSRTLAPVDWDFDGRLDLWLTNRTTPRVRLMRNQWRAATGGFLAVRLAGVRCHPDAVGARVELKTGRGVHRRTVRLGEGFQTQGTLWQHLSYGTETPEELAVTWPGGAREVFTGWQPGAWHVLTQGRGAAEKWQPPAVATPAPGPLPPPAAAAVPPVLPPARPLFPALALDDGTAWEPRAVSVVSVWSLTCAPCVAEIREWSKEAAVFSAAGLEVALLNLETDAPAGRAEKTAAVLKDAPAEFVRKNLTPRSGVRLDVLQRSLALRQSALAFPTTFLVDRAGRLAAIYTGRVSAATLAADAARLFAAGPEQWRSAAFSSDGLWLAPPPAEAAGRYAMRLRDEGDADFALQWLRRACAESRTGTGVDIDSWIALAALEKAAGQPARAREAIATAARLDPKAGRARLHAAGNLIEDGDLSGAETAVDEALREDPHNAEALTLLASLRIAQQRLPDAAAAARRALDLKPGEAEAHCLLGFTLQHRGDHAGAVEHYRAALARHATHATATSQLAWLLATTASESLRAPDEALKLATRLTTPGPVTDPLHCMALGAAHAATGDFTAAARDAEAGAALARKGPGGEKLARRLELQAENYRQHRAIRIRPGGP